MGFFLDKEAGFRGLESSVGFWACTLVFLS
jgi:hypothetical protein